MADYRARGAADVIAQAREVLAGRPVYITFDLDCLDPSVAPAVANIEPSVTGFSMDEAVELAAARGLNIIGGDVVCMMPTKDSPNNITAMVGGAIMFEMISMIAETIGKRQVSGPASLRTGLSVSRPSEHPRRQNDRHPAPSREH